MTVGEYRESQKRRVMMVSRSVSIAGVVLGTLLVVQGFLSILESSIKYVGLGRQRQDRMTLREFRGSHRRRLFAVGRSVGLAALALFTLFAVSAAFGSRNASSNERQAKPEKNQQLPVAMMMMMQNSAISTPQGLVVLQGNRLLHYSTKQQLQHAVTLPLIAVSEKEPQVMASGERVADDTRTSAILSMRSQVSAQILPTAGGFIVIRGQQIVWLDDKFNIVSTALLPELPPLTSAEIVAIHPVDSPVE